MILSDLLDYETLRLIWWVLLGVLLIAFAAMDGFDLGVDILMPVIGKTDVERRIIINTIGPVWEGNQVWLILGAVRFSPPGHRSTPCPSRASIWRCLSSCSRSSCVRSGSNIAPSVTVRPGGEAGTGRCSSVVSFLPSFSALPSAMSCKASRSASPTTFRFSTKVRSSLCSIRLRCFVACFR